MPHFRPERFICLILRTVEARSQEKIVNFCSMLTFAIYCLLSRLSKISLSKNKNYTLWLILNFEMKLHFHSRKQNPESVANTAEEKHTVIKPKEIPMVLFLYNFSTCAAEFYPLFGEKLMIASEIQHTY